MRDLLDKRVTGWEDHTLETLRKYQAEPSARTRVLLDALVLDENDEHAEVVELFADPIHRRRALLQKNRFIAHIDRFLVTSE